MAIIELKVKTIRSIAKTTLKGLMIVPLFIKGSIEKVLWESKVLEIDMTEEKFEEIHETCLFAKVRWKYPREICWRASKHIEIYKTKLIKRANRYEY